MTAEAWFLYDSSTGRDGLVREPFELGAPAPGEVVAAPLFGAWEGNMGHAIERRPVDICRQRDEERVVIGNAGVVRVVTCGEGVTSLRPGDLALVFSGSELDEFGYPKKILGYDARGTMGCLATKIRIREDNLLPIPKGTRHPLPQWAAFSLRYITAWSSFAMAIGTYRLLVGDAEDPAPHVWGWGGGTTLAAVDLARRRGCRAAMLSGSDERLATIRGTGVEAIDRRPLRDLQFDEEKFATDADARRRYMRAESAFLALVREKTQGRGVQIFFDNIGGPVLRATMRALSREGILATCGWKEGMNVSYLRSVACIARQQHVNTHYATRAQGIAAISYAEEHGWLPPMSGPIASFEEVPELAREFAENRAGMFPVYKVNEP